MFRGARLKNRPVINSQTAQKLGTVCDIEIDEVNGRIVSIIVIRGGVIKRFLGLGEFVIPWQNIIAVGVKYILTDIYAMNIN